MNVEVRVDVHNFVEVEMAGRSRAKFKRAMNHPADSPDTRLTLYDIVFAHGPSS